MRTGRAVIAALLDASERKQRIGADRRSVPVHHARLELQPQSLEPRLRPGEECHGQPIRRSIGPLHGLLLRVDNLDQQIGPEELPLDAPLRRLDVANQVQAGPHKVALRCPLHGCSFEERLEPSRLLLCCKEALVAARRGERTHHAALQLRVVALHPLQPHRELVEQRLCHAACCDQAAHAGAALPRRCGRRSKDCLGRQRQVCIIQNDRCVLAAELQRDELARLRRGGPDDGDADRVGAGEGDAVDARMGRQRCARLTAALNELEQARIGAALLCGLLPGEEVAFCAASGPIGGLEDAGVARHERCKQLPVRQVNREVEGADHRHHAERYEVVAGVGRRLLALQLRQRDLLCVFPAREHALHLGGGIYSQFAGLSHDLQRNLGRVFTEPLIEPVDDGDALCERPKLPSPLRPAPLLDRGIDERGALGANKDRHR